MPLVHPTDVVSFSSEDPHHPASNLLNRETFRKWKCKEPGEKEAYVILKFEKAVTITNIDIGNDGSALVEVSVARSGGSGEPQFEVILCSTSFMTPLDSRESKNLNSVRSFSLHSLSKPIAAQKWDLVKVLVSQPFNRHVQFGLTFIKFIAAPDPNEPQKIGIFGIRKPIAPDSDDEDDVRPGALFTALKSPEKAGPLTLFKPKPISASSSTYSAIKEATDKLGVAAKSSSEKEVKSLLQKPKIDLPASSSSPSSNSKRANSGTSSPLLSRKQLEDKPKKDKPSSSNPASVKASNSPASSGSSKSSKKRALSPDKNGQRSNGNGGTPTPSTSKVSSPAKKKPKRKTKPFNQLFQGVVFSMSGFENPLRGQLRDKALEMGARYKGDWDASCTHLICAFYNTPKFRTVKNSGNGKIVKKDWILECYSKRCRIPWRRFCLDRNDKGTESEEEIYAEEDEGANDEIMDEEMENGHEETEINTSKRKRVMVLDSSDESENDNNSNDNDSKKAYEAETDVDEDKTPDLSPSLFDAESGSPFFENIKFYVESGDDEDQNHINDIIVKHKGLIEKRLTEDCDYYICPDRNWNEEFTDALSDNGNLTFIHKDWIIECDKEDSLVDKKSFVLLPP